MKLGHCFLALFAGMLFAGIIVAMLIPKRKGETRRGGRRKFDKAKEGTAGEFDYCKEKYDATEGCILFLGEK